MHPARLVAMLPRFDRHRWVRLGALALLAVAGAAGAEPFAVRSLTGSLDGPTTWPGAPAIEAADFNGDGALSWYAGGNVINHFPKSGTTTLPAISLPVCPACTPRPITFAVFDVDDDGYPDIVRIVGWNGHDKGHTLQVYRNNGSGGFTLGWRTDWERTHASLAWEELTYRLVPGDFNRNGQIDLLVVSSYRKVNLSVNPRRWEGGLAIRWNDGGQFGTSQVVQSQFIWGTGTHVSDIDRDGYLDIVTMDHTEWFQDVDGRWIYRTYRRTFRNDGAGWFHPPSDVFGYGDELAELKDINRDGWPDLTINPFSWDTGYWRMLNDGAGNFPSGTLLFPYLSELQRGGVVAWADINEDGIPDLLYNARLPGQSGARTLVVRKGTGNDQVGEAITLTAQDSPISAITAADIDGDGDIDILLQLENGQYRLVENLAQRLHPRFGSSHHYSLPGVTRLAAADMNRNGRVDLVAPHQPSGSLPRFQLLQANGSELTDLQFRILPSSIGLPADFVLTDLDNDGRVDIAYVAPGGGGQVHAIMNRHTPSLWSPHTWPGFKIDDHAGASMIRAGHYFVDDGKTDLLVASGSAGGVRWLRNPGGDLSTWTRSTISNSQNPAPLGLHTLRRHFGKEHTAFVLTSYDDVLDVAGYSNVFPWNAYPWAPTAERTEPRPAPVGPAMLDFNLDGALAPRLVYQSGAGKLVAWKPSTNALPAPLVIDDALPGILQAVAAVDWNRDGRPDLLTGTSQGLFLHERTAGGWVRWSVPGTAGRSITSIAVADFNRDGLSDVAFVDATQERVVVTNNDSSIVSVPGWSTSNPTIQPNTTAKVFSFNVRNPGRSGDAAIALTDAVVQFRHLTPGAGGQWLEGNAMTKAEVQQVVSGVSLWANETLIAGKGTNDVNTSGVLQLAHTALGTAVPIAGDGQVAHELRVTLTANAAAAPFPAFRVAFVGGPQLGARVLINGAPTGRKGSAESDAGGNFVINRPPEFKSTPPTAATQGIEYSYAITATDPNPGASLTLSASTKPDWLSFTTGANGSATLAGTPAAEHVGKTYPVMLWVTDGVASPVQQSFTIEVLAANAPPVFTSAPVTDATMGMQYSYSIATHDPNPDAVLTITAPTKPAWLSFQASGQGTALLSGTPGPSHVGTHAVVLKVSDGIAPPAEQSFVITVVDTGNQPPVVSDQTFTVGVTAPIGSVVGTIAFQDPNPGDSHSVALHSGSGQGIFGVSQDGVMTVAAALQEGSYTLDVSVVDAGGLSDTAVMTIHVSGTLVFRSGFE
jgi:hypothetical protein